MAGLFADAPESIARLALAPWLVAFAVALLLGEVFLRRFFSGRVRRARRPVVAGSPIFTPAPMPAVRVAPPPAEAPPVAAPSPEPTVNALDAAMELAKKRTQRK